ncbi:hypothetical protein ACFQY0_19695 [Haloferula chungangensis]|uniref:Uncharacterized protein n=1 Tax=Haloferula chungangensis TaxID=1048331 RepID=A0ABW2LF66_9BACT
MKSILSGLAVTSGLVMSVAAQVPQAYEIPPVLSASQILSADEMQGPHFRVRDSAPSDGYMTHFTIDSDFGVFECAGERQVDQRIQEIAAIAKLTQVSRSDLFAEGVKRSVEAPIDAVKNIVEDPKESVKQLPKTVGHFFSKVGNSISSTAKKVGKKSEESDGEMSSEEWAAAGRGAGNAAKSVAGYDKAKLDTARQLGVDPYSDNERLQEEMDKVTWAFFAGGLPLRIGASVASGGASMALTATKTVGLPTEIYDVTPSELALRDRDMMIAMGVPAPTIDTVFMNPALTISLRHGILTTLNQMPGGPGRVDVVTAVAALEKHGQADFFLTALKQLAARHATAPYLEVKLLGRLPGGLTADEYLEIAAPVDYVSWTQQVAEFARRDDLTGARKRLLITGKMSEAAAAGFADANWQVVYTK